MISKGFEYLENTPDKSKAITWAVVDDGERKVAVCNTHFWWMQGDEPEHVRKWLEYSTGKSNWSKEVHDDIRKQNAIQLSSLMKHLANKYSCSVFAFGDMNATTASYVFKVYAENELHQLIDLACEKDEKCSIMVILLEGLTEDFTEKRQLKTANPQLITSLVWGLILL